MGGTCPVEVEESHQNQGGGRTGGYTKTKDKGKVTFGSGGQKPNLKAVRCTASVSFMSEKEISGCDQGGRTGGYTGDGALVVACDSCYFGLVVIKCIQDQCNYYMS